MAVIYVGTECGFGTRLGFTEEVVHSAPHMSGVVASSAYFGLPVGGLLRPRKVFASLTCSDPLRLCGGVSVGLETSF